MCLQSSGPVLSAKGAPCCALRLGGNHGGAEHDNASLPYVNGVHNLATTRASIYSSITGARVPQVKRH